MIKVDYSSIKQRTHMKISPWHSDEPGIEVYHNNTRCTEGNNIEARNRKPGTGGKRLCNRCRHLNEEERK